jgi:hypothetical protein
MTYLDAYDIGLDVASKYIVGRDHLYIPFRYTNTVINKVTRVLKEEGADAKLAEKVAFEIIGDFPV